MVGQEEDSILDMVSDWAFLSIAINAGLIPLTFALFGIWIAFIFIVIVSIATVSITAILLASLEDEDFREFA